MREEKRVRRTQGLMVKLKERKQENNKFLGTMEKDGRGDSKREDEKWNKGRKKRRKTDGRWRKGEDMNDGEDV